MSPRDAVIGADEFTASAQRIVEYLNAHTPIPDWSVSRMAGGEQVHVHVHPGELITTGLRVDWDETFCARMTDRSHRVVPDARLDSVFAKDPRSEVVRAYASVPITDDDGTVFGTLCGAGTAPLGADDTVDEDLMTLMGDLLSSQLAMSRSADRDRRAVAIAEALAQTDALTGLTNRRGWNILVADAQQRVDAYGDPVAVAVLDLDGLKAVNDAKGHEAGDDLIRRAAAALLEVAEDADRVARYGGDEFAILSNNVAVHDLPRHFGTFVTALEGHGVNASLGFTSAGPGLGSLSDAFNRADEAMYRTKQRRRRAPRAPDY